MLQKLKKNLPANTLFDVIQTVMTTLFEQCHQNKNKTMSQYRPMLLHNVIQSQNKAEVLLENNYNMIQDTRNKIDRIGQVAFGTETCFCGQILQELVNLCPHMQKKF